MNTQTGNYFDPGSGNHVLVDGKIVERDALNIAERIQDYDENLVIMCLDVDDIGLSDAPFVICESQPNGVLKRVFECWELNASVLDRIAQADGHRFDALKRVDTINDAVKQQKENRYKDKQEELKDIVAHAAKTAQGRASKFSFKNDKDELVTIHSDKPPTHGVERSISYGRPNTN